MAKVKNKKSKLADVYAKKRKKQQTQKTLTPFEVHVNRDKRKVLGQKTKADRGLPGVARTKAIAKRKGTLLQEYKVKDRDNVLLDKRIYQRNPHISEEDKALARFAKERMKAQSKKNIYNLNDEEILTHRGQAIMDIERFDNPNSEDDEEVSDEENRGGRLNKRFLEEAHFGGGLLSMPDSETSRKSVIEQLIADSKKRKAERQKTREETEELTAKLDSQWKDLLPLLVKPSKEAEKPVEKPRLDDYDMTVRELKFEARGQATDKLKSEEQIAQEEHVKWEKLEEERLKRMSGFSENDLYNKHKSADDLDDGYQRETVDGEEKNDEQSDNENDKSKGSESEGDSEDGENEEEDVDEEMEDEEEEENEEEEKVKENEKERVNRESDGTEAENEPESEEEDDEDNLSDLKDTDSSSEDEVPPQKFKSSKTKPKTEPRVENKTGMQKLKNASGTEDAKIKESLNEVGDTFLENARENLPHTYTVPETFEHLKKLLRKHDQHHQSIIVERIIKCNHWILANGNREKLFGLLEHLLMYIDCFDFTSADSIVKSFQILDRLCPHLYDLAHAGAENVKKCFQEIIKAKHEQFEENKKKYPGINLLIFLKLASLIFPTSDFRHPVVTPCLVFMSQILLRCSVKRKSHIARGLYVTTLILEYTLLSKRFSPSAINFLRGLLYISIPKTLNNATLKVLPPFKKQGEFSCLLVLDENMTNSKIDLNKVKMKASDLLEDEIDSDFKIRVFVTTINLISEFKKLYEELEASYAIFEPILKMLKCDFIKHYPKNLRLKVKELVEELEAMKSKKLEHIVREKKKPKTLRLYEPRIERVYEGRRHKKMSGEKAEKAKMLHKLKRETKGAIREVRRDTAFLAKLKIKEQIKNDEERKRKVREIFGDAAVQQSEFNQMKRQK